LFDGDDAAVRAVAADPKVDEDVRAGLLEALARLAWEGRASREALVELLDRFDREELAPPASWAWYGWHSAIMLLGLTDWIERVQRASDAGRMVPLFTREVDRVDWLEGIHAAAEQPDDPQRFVSASLMPFDDPTKLLGWWTDPAGDPDDPLSEDESSWLDVALWRRAGTDTMCLERADGFFTALAVGPEQRRTTLIELLPNFLIATWKFWRGEEHPLLETMRERVRKIGRNELCPCGSGKKYKRCCGAAA
jgi:SEC-C motif